ncbi:MAG: pyridoxal phosphate-dependent aminotransferase, partial [Candidatus Dormibacteraceae bacterium]
MSSHGVDSFNPSFPISDDLTRLHLSESPFGASTLALQAAQAVLKHVSMYPDPGRTDIVTALARLWRVSSEQLAVGNGSDELVLLTSMALGQVKEPGLVTGGTFPGYATCLTKIGRGPT